MALTGRANQSKVKYLHFKPGEIVWYIQFLSQISRTALILTNFKKIKGLLGMFLAIKKKIIFRDL